jgi:hypothetical protein
VLAVIGLVSGGSDDNSPSSSGGTTTHATKPKKKQKRKQQQPASTPKNVTLRIVPANQVYVCIDSGPGSAISFNGIIDAPRTFHGGRVMRVNLGKTDLQLTKNGKPVTVQPGPEPVGFTFTPTSTKPLALGDRPCA